ncbi:hypothetical protein FO519_009387 [Halicephalobus sp. NKZ332]|nr:hypothetical protein FO519_009387 [Halicephalobus sp. NKZ332]
MSKTEKISSPSTSAPDDGQRLLAPKGDLELSSKDQKDEVRDLESRKSLSEEDESCFLRHKFRYAILILTVLCLTFTRSNELSFNFTVICMNMNTTEGHKEPPVEMSISEISKIMGSGGLGALVSVMPLVHLLHNFGPRSVFSVLLFFSGLATIALGPLAKISPLWMLPGRIIQGFALSTVMPMTGAVSAEWAPLTEIGKFVTMLSAAGQLSQILTMPMSAFLCVESGWSSVYTAHGILAIIGSLGFFALYRNSAKNHPCITEREFEIISQGSKQRPRRGDSVPYWEIAKTKSVWAVWIAFLGNAIGFQLIVQFMPTFLNKVLSVPVRRTGSLSIIPPITQLLVKIIAGYASDQIPLTEKLKLRLFNSAAQIGCAMFLLPLGFIGIGDGNFAIVCFAASISCLGLVSCGSMKSATLIARGYTHFVMAVVQVIVCISMLFVPFMVAVIASENTIDQWRWVFFLVFLILVMTNTVFCVLCGAEPEPWALTQKK